jgi:hypothetical protein
VIRRSGTRLTAASRSNLFANGFGRLRRTLRGDYGRTDMTELHLHVTGYSDSDDEERAELAGRLRQELLDQGIDEVAHPSTPPPEGAKGSAVEWAQLVVGFAGTVPPLIMALQGWLGRHPRAAVELEIDGDRLILDKASPADQRRLVEAFLDRHGGD